jgi:hypothetical protein
VCPKILKIIMCREITINTAAMRVCEPNGVAGEKNR